MLLDTHVVLWWLADDLRRATPAVISTLEARPDEVIISAVVIWEASIKRQLGKLDPPMPDLLDRLLAEETSLMAISARHGDRAGGLPLHHRDPFDRLLIAQAQIERLPIVTVDPAIKRYDVETIG